jgi:pyruvate formate-lyase activating enzyme-like uncharacterized protein
LLLSGPFSGESIIKGWGIFPFRFYFCYNSGNRNDREALFANEYPVG